MDTTRTDSTEASWRRVPPDSVAAPVVRRVPYLELKLEHPSLDPTASGEQFYPDAVPYEVDGEHRVFYWRSGLPDAAPDPADWRLACATTHGLAGAESLPASPPPLTTDGAVGTVVVVDGTVAGEVTTARLDSYAVPSVRIEAVDNSAVELSANGTSYAVPSGDRRRIELPRQRVEAPGKDDPSRTVTPVLAARYPGPRTVYHPAPGASYRLFPSFGLDLSAVPNPLPVPLAAGELDDERLAETIGVDLSARPYAERVLWQAFAYTAFDPHADSTPKLAQLPRGHVALRVD
ncbi:hypothetical protein G9464_16420 [Halostella sp. JP-L12]|uniref:hypothetical protein n=1 Tax=Halostella TaxID=1843185 RepID=UPI000EF79EF1|nr:MULTISPECIES: hypothetical protein [Halostella]NHN49165.1 hypothetical protein [Halostella sp. JP-L12]